jgi:hypothetical protein
MAEILVNSEVCEKCGAEVRINAAFCYNCGSQVVSDEMLEALDDGQVSNAWFKENITEAKSEPIRKPAESLNAQKIADKSGVELTPLAESENSEPKPEVNSKQKTTGKLEAAASIREKSKPAPRKKVEVTWEEPRSAPNIWFLIVAFILLSLAVGLVFAMLYIR